ncbi:MAG: trypsin-like peptidase domain-containing protein [Thermoguttaceae bacterium]|nr:trypsin-like peptidase domain-containing protein [Thermoguttaceae bacterium]
MSFLLVAMFFVLAFARRREVWRAVLASTLVVAASVPELVVAQRTEDGAVSKRFDPLRRDALGAQTRYPAVAKIVGRDATQTKEDGSQTIPLYYGTGTLVAEVGEWGIVVTNWHVVNASRDSIVVKFPTFSSPARAILRDDYWDLAALIVRKPPRVAPIPISMEAPEIGDALWVAGYGWSAGLTDFQIQAGRLVNYAEIVADENAVALAENGEEGESAENGEAKRNASASAKPFEPSKRVLYETLAIDKGVRQGDSGGPIFNRYGELAGVLWGSNGRATMGTYGIRVQYFLTQAIKRLAILEAERRLDEAKGDFLDWRLDDGVARAEGSDVSAREAFPAAGAYPISTVPIYVAADGRETAENLMRLEKEVAVERTRAALTAAENATTTALPPSPPVFSETFVKRQRDWNRVRPEVAETDVWARTSEWALRTALASRASKTSNVASETSVVDGFVAAPLAASETQSEREERVAAKPELPVARWTPVSNGEEKSANETDSNGGEKSADAADSNGGEKLANAADSNGEEKSADAADSNGGEKSANAADSGVEEKLANGAERKNRVNFNGVYFSDFQVYLIVCMIFCLFYNAARLMTEADGGKKRRKRRGERAIDPERRAG